MTTVMNGMDLNARQRFGVNACPDVKRAGSAHRELLPARPPVNDAGSAPEVLRLADRRKPRPGGAEWQECGNNTATATTSMTGALREVNRMTRFEQLAYAALWVGGAVSIGAGFVNAEKLMAGWPAFAKFVEGFLS